MFHRVIAHSAYQMVMQRQTALHGFFDIFVMQVYHLTHIPAKIVPTKEMMIAIFKKYRVSMLISFVEKFALKQKHKLIYYECNG